MLSRPARGHATNDPLDQVAAIMRHLPSDSARFVQWIYALLSRRSHSVLLPHGVAYAAPPPAFHSRENQRPDAHGAPQRKPPTVHFAVPPVRQETMDGGSTTSSNSSPRDDSSRRSGTITPLNRTDDDAESIASQVVLEEDDLASVISEAPEWNHAHSPPQHTTLDRHMQNEDTKRALEAHRRLDEDEIEFIRFCSPQFAQHAASLNQQVEELFGCIEEGRKPDKFVQKITLEGQILAALSANVARRLKEPVLRAEFKHHADRLDDLVGECEHLTAALRKSRFPSVSATQSLVSAVVAISKKAQNLRLLAKT